MKYSVFTLSRVFVLVVTLFCNLLGLAEDKSLGTITGHLSDPSGGAIASATVALMDGRCAIKGTLSSDDGTYRLTALPPGRYRVRITAKGFAAIESSLFDLARTQSRVLNFTLRVESVKEQISVISELPETLNTGKYASASGNEVLAKIESRIVDTDGPGSFPASMTWAPSSGDPGPVAVLSPCEELSELVPPRRIPLRSRGKKY
jgi:hypothetical protein